MIDKRMNLTVKQDDNGVVFTDHSHKMASFGRDNVTMTISSLEDYIWIGFNKPINAVYIDVVTADVTEGSLEFSYWNGSEYISVTSLSDDTFGLFRSGFVKWDRELENQTVSTVDGDQMYWYRLRPSVDRGGLVISGINLVFSDDYELSLEQPYISDTEFLGNSLSHIKTHVAARNEIVQKFRNKNYIKIDPITADIEDINAWDLLDIGEVKMGATYLALSKIYYQLSDNPEDVWAIKSVEYYNKFEKYINLARLTIDTNDDGVLDDVENKRPYKNRYFTR